MLGNQSMIYAVKEMFHTLQGEGINAGRAAVFCRFAGCNLWSGRESDRLQSVCSFCDTDFLGTAGEGGGKFPAADSLAQAVADCWQAGTGGAVAAQASPLQRALVVLTGGEPMLQVDEPLVGALQSRGFEVALETNGTQPVPASIDWVCVSPKANAPWVQRAGDELKLVFPQPGLLPGQVEALPGLDFRHWLLQPMDGPDVAAHTRAAVAYCRTHARWRLALQWHKLLGIP